MARQQSKPDTEKRTLLGFFALVLALAALLGGAHIWGTAALNPKLGLDLKGGTQLVLSPRLADGQTVTSDQVAQARDIIAERVDSQGVSGAEVTTQGENNIVVSIPENPSRQQEDNLRRSSALQFRPVLQAQYTATTPQPSATVGSNETATGSATSSGSATGSASGSATSRSSSSNSSAADDATSRSTQTTASRSKRAATSTSSASASGSASESASESASDSGSASESESGSGSATSSESPTPSGKPTSATDLAWITPELTKQFDELDCSKPGVLDNLVDDATKPMVTCSTDGLEKFILGPVVVGGKDISNAVAGYQLAPNGQMTNTVEIQLTFDSAAAKKYGELSIEMLALPSPQNRLASTLDSRVIVAPQFNEAIPGGQASITGGFTFEQAQDLAKQLKFGALPISFDLETRSQISPTLGEEQLRLGLIAGLIGLGLVVLYSLFQYHALGLVTVASIFVAALLTYLVITILGWAQNYRLDMAGVTGLIVAIGVTADSFIVYFERIRDEVREGRTLRTAVDTGWKRARRTILAADGVNFLGALVLYLLASSSVRGFAFTLGLTTLIDILVVFMFTHPLVALLARRKFFAEGHKASGLDPERLGAKVRYVGRGQFAGPRTATRSAVTTPTAASEGSRA
ncbi:Protein translocase subunit SecD [Nostocoides australiense Ben110]|uniref:Protein translocase subunit SecD n=1 Tax=Nostocoides australiense Ben110 TaxID=1193182 RepID=W6JWK6_9MICO|nr:protein translocase subunit SecD [Tetrasphaera australiensis]CCH73015.1 Protein translocase subunit SecD [Tetrasphaera australiensis Ben110]